MPYCEHCGAELTGDKYCPSCGVKVPKKLRKKAKVNAVDVILVVDESGSMFGQREEVPRAISEFVEEQSGVDGDVFLTIYTFSSNGADTDFVTITERHNIKNYKPINYMPNGTTPLNDAIGKAIEDAVAARLPENTIFVIITDGLENASVKYNTDAIKKLISEHETTDKWKFTFLFDGLSEQESRTTLASYGASMSQGAMRGSTYSAIKGVSADLMKFRDAGGHYTVSNSMADEDEKLKKALKDKH